MLEKTDRLVRLSTDANPRAGHNWSLKEFELNGNPIEPEYYPYTQLVSFKSSEMRYIVSTKIKDSKIINVDGTTYPSSCIFETIETISGRLKPINFRYSLFQTERELADFYIEIIRLNSGDIEHRQASAHLAGVDYPDAIHIEVGLLPENFDIMRRALTNAHPHALLVNLRKVEGLYSSRWSHDFTSEIKVLISSVAAQIEIPNDYEISLPVIRNIGEIIISAESEIIRASE